MGGPSACPVTETAGHGVAGTSQAQCYRFWHKRKKNMSYWRDVKLLRRVTTEAHGRATSAKPSFTSLGADGKAQNVKLMCEEGRLEEALELLQLKDREGVVASVETYGWLLQGCMKRRALAQARKVHALICKNGLESNRSLGNTLVNVFVHCGSLSDAIQVFNRLPRRNAHSWTALILGHTKRGQFKEALRTYHQMQEEGFKPNKFTFVGVLKACASLLDLKEGSRIHAEVTRSRLETDLFVGTTLVDMYASCGSMVDARHVFDTLPSLDVVTWNAMIIGYAQQEQGEEALQLFAKMQQERVQPNDRTFVSLLRACGSLASTEKETVVNAQAVKVKALQKGKEIHGQIAAMGYMSDPFVGNSLVDMYAKCGDLLEARQVFDSLPQRNAVTWNAMITGYAQQQQGKDALQLFAQMKKEEIKPNDRTFVSVLNACGSLAGTEAETALEGQSVKVNALEQGKQIHDEVVGAGYQTDPFVGNTLVDMYAKCGDMVEARRVFDNLPHRDVVSWTAMITGYAQQEQGAKALQLYAEMQKDTGVLPNKRTFVGVLKACCSLATVEGDMLVDGQPNALQQGRAIHAEIMRQGYQTDTFVGNTLVAMYAKCGDLIKARLVFDTLLHHDVVSWSAMITGYTKSEHGEMAFQLYAEMQEEGVKPNDITFISLLKVCGSMASFEEDAMVNGQFLKTDSLEKCRLIHSQLQRHGYQSSLFVCSTLIDTYAKCGDLMKAREVFDTLPSRDIVCWNAMIASYGQQNQGEKGMQLYVKMQEEGMRRDEATFLCILRLCSSVGSLEMCRKIHQDILESGIERRSIVATTLIHAYGKCGSMVDARQVFDTLVLHDVWTWTALVTGYARQGQGELSLQCFEDMQQAGVKPDAVTFVSVLAACSHAGAVDKGFHYFKSMTRDHRITPTLEHYASLVDLLGRAGLFREAEDILASMPMQPNVAMWLGLLGACRMHNNVELGKRAFQHAVDLEPKQRAAYLLLSQIYAQAGMWEQARHVEIGAGSAGAWKRPGRSWIEQAGCVHAFSVGDGTHKQSQQLFALLQDLSSRMEEE